MKKMWNGWIRKEGKIKRILNRLVEEEREDKKDMEEAGCGRKGR